MEDDRIGELKREGTDEPKHEAEDSQKQNVERKQTRKPRVTQSREVKNDKIQDAAEEATPNSDVKQTQKNQRKKKTETKSRNGQKTENKQTLEKILDDQIESLASQKNTETGKETVQKDYDGVKWEVEVNHEQPVGIAMVQDAAEEQQNEQNEADDTLELDSNSPKDNGIDVHIEKADDDTDGSVHANSEKDVFDRQNSMLKEEQQEQKFESSSEQEDSTQKDSDIEVPSDDTADSEIKMTDGGVSDTENDTAEKLQDAVIDSDAAVYDNSVESEQPAVIENNNINDNSNDTSVTHTVRKIYIELNRAFILSLAGIILLTYLITATVFSCLRYTPKTAVDQYISDMEYSVERNFDEYEVDENLKEFMGLIYNSDGEVQYRTKKAVKDGDNATVDVVFTFKDNSAVLDAALANIMDSDSYDTVSDNDFYKQLIDNFKIFTDYEDTYSKETVTFSLVKRGKCWIVDDENLDFVPLYNIYFSNTFDTFLQMSE